MAKFDILFFFIRNSAEEGPNADDYTQDVPVLVVPEAARLLNETGHTY
jgi:hypothetical protein